MGEPLDVVNAREEGCQATNPSSPPIFAAVATSRGLDIVSSGGTQFSDKMLIGVHNNS